MLRPLSLTALLPLLIAATSFDWPDTSAARAARDYFAAYADGSEAALRDFDARYRGAANEAVELERIEKAKAIHDALGTLEPIRIQASSPDTITVAAKSSVGAEVELEFTMASSKLKSIAMTTPDGESGPGMPLTSQTRADLVDKVATTLTGKYVYPDRAAAMAAKIREALASGAYDELTDERAMARRLTQDLRAVTNDKHLGVLAIPKRSDEGHNAPTLHDFGDNYAFKRVEILDGNIGYVRLDGFINEPGAKKAADAAMAFLAHADAIVFDLRYNGGGDPEMIRYLTSYFFATPTLLNSMVDRNGKVVEQYRTGKVAGKRFRADVPVFVLTSAHTFSGAEEFAYNLKNLKRGAVIGEVTGGGAHPVEPVRVSDRFVVAVPYQRALNPVTKTNWEGVGVQPDVESAADAALDKALELAHARARHA